MSSQADRRDLPDRRRTPRGGRRPSDPMGYSPLVLVADDDADSGARCVAILARLRFAVAPAHSRRRPVLILTGPRLGDEPKLRAHMAANPAIGDIPLVTLTAENDAPL